jgi:hypothetical protein
MSKNVDLVSRDGSTFGQMVGEQDLNRDLMPSHR